MILSANNHEVLAQCDDTALYDDTGKIWPVQQMNGTTLAVDVTVAELDAAIAAREGWVRLDGDIAWGAVQLAFVDATGRVRLADITGAEPNDDGSVLFVRYILSAAPQHTEATAAPLPRSCS